MKVKKTVELSRKQIISALKKVPGLSKTERLNVIRNYDGAAVDGIKFEVSWTEEEVVEGIFGK